MSIKVDKSNPKKYKNDDTELVVYEPVRRTDKESDNTLSPEKLKLTKNFCGLYNRGNTCYLNSLIQALFMTPEFRENILSWKFEEYLHGNKEDSIPFQLQKLFARMQLKFREIETTEDLTKSFQWNNSQLMEQHDIQELCRVLFEAIEISFINSEENFIEKLYAGESTSIVKCLECGFMSQRKDRFLDISIPVRNEFDKIYNSSLEMALMNLVKEEKLEKDNQYKCDLCEKKVDALKLMKFLKLPKILFLQLNRFDYDFTTDSRRKLFDRFTFPKILNLNTFSEDYEKVKEVYNKDKLKELEKREKIENEEESQNLIEEYFKEGENVYELFNIVVHTGTPRGGHYYSNIKNFENNLWYKFEDSQIYEMNNFELTKTFSDGDRHFTNNPTGYILMYRKIERKGELVNFNNSIVPTNLMNYLEEENQKIKIEEELQIERMNTLQLKFIYEDKIINIFEKKQNTIKSLKIQVLKNYDLENIKKENIRIRNINTTNFKFLEAFDDEEKEYNFNSNKTYSLEVKKENEEFEVYNKDIIIINICTWDVFYESEKVEEKDLNFLKLKIDKKISVKNFIKFLEENLKINSLEDYFVFRKLEYAHSNYKLSEIKFCENEEKEEKEEKKDFENYTEINPTENYLFENSKIFVEKKSEEWKNEEKKIEINKENITQKEKDLQEFSKFKNFFDDRLSNFTVNFNMPIKQEKKIRITVGSYKFNQMIEIKPNKTLKDLKIALADYLKISEDEFIMKKLSHNGVELKNLGETLDKICSGSLKVYIEYGTPQKENQIKLNIFSCELDMSFFLLFPYKITEIGIFDIETSRKNLTIKDLKNMLIEELKTKKGIEFENADKLILREYLNERPAKEITNPNGLKPFDKNDIQLTIREWDSENWQVSKPIDIHIKKKTTCLEFAGILFDYLAHINFENLYEKSDFNIESFPLFINNDGYMLLVMDNRRIPRKPTEEEKRLYCKPKISRNIGKSVNSGTSYASAIKNDGKVGKFDNRKFREKEKALKITVKKNENFELKENLNTNDEVLEVKVNTNGNCNEKVNGLENKKESD